MQLDALVHPLAGFVGIEAIGQEFVRRPAQEAGDQPAAAQIVDHRELLGGPHRIEEGQDRPEHGDLRVAHALADRCGGDQRTRCHGGAVMMLRDGHEIEAQIVRQLEHPHAELRRTQSHLGPEQFRRDDAAALQLAIAIVHGIEDAEFHRASPRSGVANL